MSRPRFYLLARHFWPGELTIIVSASSRIPLKVTGNTGRLAMRQSKSKWRWHCWRSRPAADLDQREHLGPAHLRAAASRFLGPWTAASIWCSTAVW